MSGHLSEVGENISHSFTGRASPGMPCFISSQLLYATAVRECLRLCIISNSLIHLLPSLKKVSTIREEQSLFLSDQSGSCRASKAGNEWSSHITFCEVFRRI